jgi:hypothetical protein
MVVTIDVYWIDNGIYWITSQLHSITTESPRTPSVSQQTAEYLTTNNSSARGLLARAWNLLPGTGSHN